MYDYQISIFAVLPFFGDNLTNELTLHLNWVYKKFFLKIEAPGSQV